jgi:hypothetical protein
MDSLTEPLKLGVIGLSGVALFYVATVIYKEQGRSGAPRKDILRIATFFMGFCTLLVIVNSFVQVAQGGLPSNSKAAANLYVKEATRIQDLPPREIAQSLSPTSGGLVWGEFYRYRATIRSLLRHLCDNNSIPISKTESMQDMDKTLEARGIILEPLRKDIDKISHATFAAQWGDGDLPTPDEALFVAQNAPRVINDLNNLLK